MYMLTLAKASKLHCRAQ